MTQQATFTNLIMEDVGIDDFPAERVGAGNPDPVLEALRDVGLKLPPDGPGKRIWCSDTKAANRYRGALQQLNPTSKATSHVKLPRGQMIRTQKRPTSNGKAFWLYSRHNDLGICLGWSYRSMARRPCPP